MRLWPGLFVLLMVQLAGLVCSRSGWSQDRPTASAAPPGLTSLAREAREALNEGGPRGRVLFSSRYVNLVLQGDTNGGDFALVAGTHSESFPYFETKPWDNGLLLVGQERLHFTWRENGTKLKLRLGLDAASPRVSVAYDGPMIRASDGASIPVHLAVGVQGATRWESRHLGIPLHGLLTELSGLLGSDHLIPPGRLLGMDWQPFSLPHGSGQVRIGDGAPVTISEARGQLERGSTVSFRNPRFAFAYDYVAVAGHAKRPEDPGSAFVNFTSHALHRRSALGKILDAYLVRTASACVTLDNCAGSTLRDGNTHRVQAVPPSDQTVVLFENVVPLGLADLHRQMIKVSNRHNLPQYGLREIFVPVER